MYKNNNPLNVNVMQRNQGFKKKQNVQIFDDKRQVSSGQNQILNTTNDSFNRSMTLNQTLDNTFLLNQISSNQKLLDKLSQKVQESIMEKSQMHTQEFVDRKVQKLIKEEMSEFKVQLTEFLAKFITKQKNIAQEEQIASLQKEIETLKSQSIQPNQNSSGITEEKSHILDKEILYIKSNLEVLKANIQDIKENENILEDKINAQLQTMSMANSQIDCNLKRELKNT